MSKVVNFFASDGKEQLGEGGGGVMSMVVQFLILDEEPWIRILTVIRCISVLTGFYSKLGIL